MHCPVCRANNDTGPQCRRCRADLSLLWDLAKRRALFLSAAGNAIAAGQLQRGTELARQADGLGRDEQSRRLLALGHLLRRDFAAAWRYYQRMSSG